MGAPQADGLSSASPIEPVPVSPLRASIPSAFFLLLASQGEYSDRREWPISLYEREDQAKADAVLGEALHRQLFGQRYVPWDECKARWASIDGQQLKMILGEECGENDDLYLYCTPIPLRTAQAIEARRAATGTGAVHESAVGATDAPPPSPTQDETTNSEGGESHG